jgi:hypothetical protein
MGIEEGEEVQAKVTFNIFKKIIAENFPNLEKKFIQVQEAISSPNRHVQNITFSEHIIVKTISIENKERILKATRKKNQITYNSQPIKITADFLSEILKARRHGVRYFEH